MTLRPFLLLLPALAACATDTGFQNGTDDKVAEVGNGVLEVSSDYLNYEEVALTFAESLTFTVTSSGEDPLEISGARLVANPGAAFTFVEKEDLTMAIGDQLEWTVAAYLTAEGKYEGSLRIESNDATTPTLYISLCAVSTGYAESCPAEPGGSDSGDTGSGEDTGTDTGDSGA